MGRRVNPEVSANSLPRRIETAGTVNTKEIQNYEKEALLELQSRLGLGKVWGSMEIPLGWVPPGVCSSKGTRVLNMRFENQDESMCEEDGELAILTLTRYALLCFLVPVAGSRGGSVLLAPTTISSCIKHLRILMKLALQESSATRTGVFSRLRADDLRVRGLQIKQLTELNRLLQFKSRGYWSDTPILVAPENPKSASRASKCEPVGIEDPLGAGKPRSEPFLPFSDEFIGESGWRMAWIVEHLGPILIPCAENLAMHYQGLKSRSKTRHATESKRSGVAAKFLSSYDWTDSNGNALTELPFQVSMKVKGRGVEFSWPPKTHAELKGLLVLLEVAQLYIVLLSTGGRASETLSFQDGASVESTDGTATIAGRTYKLVTMRGGEMRDWPIPSLGVLAVHQQERLARIAGEINLNGGIEDSDDDVSIPIDEELELHESVKSSIWRRVGTGKPILGDYNGMLASAIDTLGLAGLSDGVNPHAHRFRKTVARLLALALVDAPKILMDLFGHKTIEMTLHYMLTDPLIRAEMQEVLKAQAIMLAVDAIEQIDEYGGPAATKIKTAVESSKVRLGREFGAKDIRDLAEIFTLSGKFWVLVRPGVICTKLPQQAGPCNKQIGMPEPSRCRPHCDFRLEQAALRDEVDRAIEQAFQFLEEAVQDDNEIAAEMWLGQVYANLDRFPGLRQKWECRLADVHPQKT